MKDEIKEILDRLERIDHKEYTCPFEFADSSSFTETARCFKERKMLADYITNLQEEYEKADNDRHKLFEQKEKAIEYCNKEIGNIIANFDYVDTKDLENVRKILQGEDKE